MQEAEARPPYVMFETRPVEDRAASIEQGQYVAKDVIFAIVTPAGSKDRLEKVAEDWIRDLTEAVMQERFPATWLDAYKQKLEMFKRNEEIPEDGTPIKGCTIFSPAEVKNILGINIRTVEDMAVAPDEALMRLGMGARMLKTKAQSWLDSANGKGKQAAENAALKAQNEQLQNTVETMQAQLAELAKKVELSEVKEKA